MRTLLATLLVVSFAPTADAKCARPTQRPEPIAKQVTVPAEGGLLVGTVDGNGDTDEGEALQPKWMFKQGKKTAKPDIVTLAPGLVVYRLPKGMTDADLIGGKKTRGHVTVTKDAVAVLDAPTLTRVSQAAVDKAAMRPNQTTTAVLAAPAPAGAVAMIVSDAATSAPLSYRMLDPQAPRPTEIAVYFHSHCDALPNGTVWPQDGQRVVVRWVDGTGRLSPVSKPVMVGK